MYLGTFYFILATFIATLHCYDPDDPLKSFGTAAKNYNEAVTEIANANTIKKKNKFIRQWETSFDYKQTESLEYGCWAFGDVSIRTFL